jgi:mRNA-degrading endonuclease RelE of RelBE toxin-antitoxin system
LLIPLSSTFAIIASLSGLVYKIILKPLLIFVKEKGKSLSPPYRKKPIKRKSPKGQKKRTGEYRIALGVIMKRFLLLFAIPICFLSIFSCDSILGILDNKVKEGEISYEGRQTRSFYAYNFTEPYGDNSKNYYKIEAVHLAENSSCIIYGEAGAGISLNTAGEIAEEFRSRILNKVSDAFGPIGIMPGNNKKFVLLLLDIQDGAKSAAEPYIAGYFDYNDLLGKTSYTYSNELGMIYLDTYPGEPGSEDFYSTIAHELQHNINFIASVDYRRDAANKVYLMDTWVDEGLSSAAEDLYLGRHLDSRISHFNRDPYGTIARGNNFFVWDNHDTDNSGAILDEYATVYLFFQWIKLHASSGTGIYKDIINSRIKPSFKNPSEFTGFGAVAEAIKNHFITPPSQGIQNDWNQWDVILREWLLANFLNVPADSPYPTLGYRGDISTGVREIADPLIQLAPGEGVFSIIADQFTLEQDQADENIDYAGITREGTIHTGSTVGQNKVFAGTRLLTFNKNYDNALYKYKTEDNHYVLDTNGERIMEQDTSLLGIGYLTGIKPLSPGGESRQAYERASRFIIDAGDFLRNRRAPNPLGIGYEPK